ncbi:hypothetical protein DPX16_16729 [Anabarilius grahami]|uniref:Uncharacterized protein n=1 Tax=Anabarilius grahami TaxID=495550 RepID=A0A3N0YSG1_ANAGA|nr:hypothetical protein DPX16_16729 [Anabarilius grahami]
MNANKPSVSKKSPDVTPDVRRNRMGWVFLDDYKASFEALAVTEKQRRPPKLSFTERFCVKVICTVSRKALSRFGCVFCVFREIHAENQCCRSVFCHSVDVTAVITVDGDVTCIPSITTITEIIEIGKQQN